MFFRLTREGRPMARALSLFSEMFCAMGLAELAQAAGDEALWARAEAMYEFLVPRFGLPSDTPMLGYPMEASFHLHSHDMCRIMIAWVFNELRPSPKFEEDLALSARSIVGRHWKPELNALLENVAMDGAPMLDLPEGRMFHPGHSIESGWMLMEIGRKTGDPVLTATAVDIVLAALEQGWDKEYGGIRYLTNLDWTPTHELEANLKLWWVHCETLYALLLGWSLTGRAPVRIRYGRDFRHRGDGPGPVRPQSPPGGLVRQFGPGLGPGDAEAAGSLRELFAPGLRVALLVGVGLSVFGQLSGVNIVVYYGPRILTGAAFSTFAVICAGARLFFHLLVPETKGQTLE